MERVLLGTIISSGTRMAQYMGGHSITKKHRSGSDGDGDSTPISYVTWEKQREVLDIVLHTILAPITGTNTNTGTNSSTGGGSNELYPPSWQSLYMVERSKPTWCNGHGSMYDYCYGQKPVDMAGKLESVKKQVIAAMFQSGRLDRLNQQRLDQQHMGTGVAAPLSVMEMLDSATTSMWGEEATYFTTTNISAVLTNEVNWPIHRVWLNTVTSLSSSTHAGVRAAAYGELLTLQDRLVSTLALVQAQFTSPAASATPLSLEAKLGLRNLRGHLKALLVAVTGVLDVHDN